MRLLPLLAVSFLLLSPPAQAQAPAAPVKVTPPDNIIETDFAVTVKARDGMFVGSAAGGAEIVIRDRRTGDIIVHGTAYGGSGDPAKLGAETRKRGEVLVDKDTAKFQFSIEIFEPTPVTVSATGPLGQGQALATVSEDMILIPGKDYTAGNGIMLELPGFAVDVLDPPAGTTAKLDPKKPIQVAANVLKMSGDPLAPGTRWDPARYEVEARVYKGDVFVALVPMEYGGKPGLFGQNLKLPSPGLYRVVVTAFDRETKEAGMDSSFFTMAQ
jgi:hypothetical protein